MNGENLWDNQFCSIVADHEMGQPRFLFIFQLKLHSLQYGTAIDPVSFNDPVDGNFFWTGYMDDEIAFSVVTALENDGGFHDQIWLAGLLRGPVPEIKDYLRMQNGIQYLQGGRIGKDNGGQ